MTLMKTNTDPFDVLFKNFFNNDSFFAPALETKITHPVDIYETKEGLHFEIACTGLSKEDVNINIEGDILRVTYEKDGENEKESDNMKCPNKECRIVQTIKCLAYGKNKLLINSIGTVSGVGISE